MQYYNPTNKTSVENMRQSLIEKGFNVSVNMGKCKIIRKTSKYNKYMKWAVTTKFKEAGSSYEYFKTKPAAFRYLEKPARPVPVGNRMLISYIEIEEGTK